MLVKKGRSARVFKRERESRVRGGILVRARTRLLVDVPAVPAEHDHRLALGQHETDRCAAELLHDGRQRGDMHAPCARVKVAGVLAGRIGWRRMGVKFFDGRRVGWKLFVGRRSRSNDFG